MNDDHGRICPVERASHLDSGWRRWLQDPMKILRPHVGEGMTVLDVGCGPGFLRFQRSHLRHGAA